MTLERLTSVFDLCTVHVVTFTLLKTNSCTYFKTLFHIHIKTLKPVKMFCKKRHYKNPTCFGHYSMTIFRGRPSFLVHLLPFSCLLRHLSFFGYVAVCHLFVCVRCTCLCAVWSCFALPDSTQTGTPENRIGSEVVSSRFVVSRKERLKQQY
jgi:hypothetical protein